MKTLIPLLPALLPVWGKKADAFVLSPSNTLSFTSHCRLYNRPSSVSLQPGRISLVASSRTVPVIQRKAADAVSFMLLPFSSPLDDDAGLPPVPVVLAFGLIVLAAAQAFIDGLTAGDGGLGAFLRDGRGYSNSAFTLDRNNRAVADDPLPWLKLPTFDYVEVAGQEEEVSPRERRRRLLRPEEEDDREVLDRLRGLRDEMERNLGSGDYEEAKRLRLELSGLLSDNSARLAGGMSGRNDDSKMKDDNKDVQP